jgi:hypothetical protein
MSDILKNTSFAPSESLENLSFSLWRDFRFEFYDNKRLIEYDCIRVGNSGMEFGFCGSGISIW